MADQRTVLLLGADVVGWGELRQILADLPGVRVVGDTADLREAQRLAAAHAPDVIIAAAASTDTPLVPQLAELRRAHCPAAKIVVVAHRYTPGQVRAPLEAGIVGYLLWADLSGAVLRHALALLLVGDVVVGSRGVVTAFVAGLRGDAAARQAAAGITARERAVRALRYCVTFGQPGSPRASGRSSGTWRRGVPTPRSPPPRGSGRAPWSAWSPGWRQSSTPPTISSWRCAPPASA